MRMEKFDRNVSGLRDVVKSTVMAVILWHRTVVEKQHNYKWYFRLCFRWYIWRVRYSIIGWYWHTCETPLETGSISEV